MQSGRKTACLGMVLAAGLAGCAHHHHGFATELDSVEVVSVAMGGKNVFIPSTLVVVAGEPTALSLYNTTDAPHGFRIRGLGVEVVLPPGEEFRLKLPALEAGRIHRIDCQLHPPHRSASLVVVPGR